MPTSVRTNYLAKIGPKFWLSWLEPSGEHIDAWTKLPPFRRRQIAFFMEKCLFPLKILCLVQLTISPAASVQIMTRLLTNHMHANICTDVNTLRPRRNRPHFPDDIFKCIFLNEDVWILIKISLNFVHMCPVNNIPALVQIMAWRRAGDKPLSEPMLVRSLAHICVTRPQWVNQDLWRHKQCHKPERAYHKEEILKKKNFW